MAWACDVGGPPSIGSHAWRWLGSGRVRGMKTLNELKCAAMPAWLGLQLSHVVRERAQFVAASVAQVPGARRYALADGGEAVLIRHNNPEDRYILGEVFASREYAIPHAAADALNGNVRSVVDLGGNIGLATLWFARMFPDARFTIVEADPVNAAVLERVIALNRVSARATVLPAAAGAETGTLSLVSGLGGRSHAAEHMQNATFASRVISVEMIDVMPALANADFLKIDIEGGEWPILADPRFSDTALKAMCLEFHPWGCPADDPTAAVTELLNRAGFTIVKVTDGGDPGVGVAWATRS